MTFSYRGWSAYVNIPDVTYHLSLPLVVTMRCASRHPLAEATLTRRTTMPYASVLTRNGPPGAFAWSPVASPDPATTPTRTSGYAAPATPPAPNTRRAHP